MVISTWVGHIAWGKQSIVWQWFIWSLHYVLHINLRPQPSFEHQGCEGPQLELNWSWCQMQMNSITSLLYIFLSERVVDGGCFIDQLNLQAATWCCCCTMELSIIWGVWRSWDHVEGHILVNSSKNPARFMTPLQHIASMKRRWMNDIATWGLGFRVQMAPKNLASATAGGAVPPGKR